MTVAELIKKLEEFPSDLEVIWEDAVEGNSSPLKNIFKSTYETSPGIIGEERVYEEVIYLGP